MTPAGFPHSDIHGSLPAFGFPWLFVDRYVLLRLPVPRHPPCALLSLTFRCVLKRIVYNHARITCSLGSLWRYHHTLQFNVTIPYLFCLITVISHSCLASHSYLFLYSVFKVHLAVGVSRGLYHTFALRCVSACLPLTLAPRLLVL